MIISKLTRNRLGAFALMIGLGLLLPSCQSSDSEALAVGDSAPAFTLPSAIGGDVSLADFQDKDVLLYFSMTDG